MNAISLFSGCGGLDLAAEAAGIRVVAQCEIDKDCRAVLRRHWPEMTIWEDVHDVTGERVRAECGDIDIVFGGFPCQPFSIAGKQKSKHDDRYLWPEMLRIISEVRPAWVLGENVENAVRLVLDDIIDDLEGIDYTARTFVVSAYCAGTWFDGKRAFIVAASNDRGATMWGNTQFQANAEVERCRDYHRRRAAQLDTRQRWALESRPAGVADGIPHRLERLRMMGNAVVPAQVRVLFEEIVRSEEDGNG